MKYRTQLEEWVTESISNEFDYYDPEYPDELLRSVDEFKRKISHALEDLADEEFVDMFNQHSCGYTFEELVESVEYEFMHEKVTCIITRADRIRLDNVNTYYNTAKNFSTVLDVYERSLMTPAQIDAENPAEVFEAEHVIELALEVLHNKVVSCDTCKFVGPEYDTEPCDGCIDFSEWEQR